MLQVMPAEWEPHARTYMAWTGDQMVATRLETAVKVDYGLVAKEIVRFEPLTVVVEPGFRADAAAYCPGAEILEHSLEDSYLRDSGPLFTRKADGTLAAVDFLFNGWGAGEPLGTVGKAIADHARAEHQPVPLVLEGGSISTNGQGTLIAVEPTVLHANRNMNASRALFEAAFAQFLGIERTIWLEHGLLEDRTGGHVDNVAAFIGPNRVACQTAQPPDRDDIVRAIEHADLNYRTLERNRETLEAAGLETVALPTAYREWAGRKIALPYVNFAFVNGGLIVPLALAPTDREALETLQRALPDREVIGVPATNLWRRGGGPHCITQQQPSDI